MEEKYILVAGVDEAGCGPLAGPVMVGAVILDPKNPIKGLNDSKKLSEKQREALLLHIQDQALAWAFARVEHDEIDRINILQATLLAMQYAVSNLKIMPQLVLIDGNQAPKLAYPTKTIINGDQLEPAISAASIVAKVLRDREMIRLDSLFPHYGFAQHKGYPTKKHVEALRKYGPCEIHRRSYAPVAEVS